MTEDRMATRQQLRDALRRRRRALDAPARILAAERLADRLLALPFAPRSGAVAGYWASDGEISLHAWQSRLPADCVYCLPVLAEGSRLMFAPWHEGAPLSTNRFGIPEPDAPSPALLEPAELALVVLPLVGFAPGGLRLGMGGGWYDRSFAFRHERAGPPWLVGAAFECQQVDALEAAPWDVALDAACTEAATHDFRSGAAV